VCSQVESQYFGEQVSEEVQPVGSAPVTSLAEVLHSSVKFGLAPLVRSLADHGDAPARSGRDASHKSVKALVSELETALLRYQQRQDIPTVTFVAEPEIVTAAETVRVCLPPPLCFFKATLEQCVCRRSALAED
jgi:hypothetical protein